MNKIALLLFALLVLLNESSSFLDASVEEVQVYNQYGFNDRPRPGQRSLLIIFDGTKSMTKDLEELRLAATQIVNELSLRQDNPIFNYILVVFRDPYNEDPLVTRNPDEVIEKLNNIVLDSTNNPDCPELAIAGLREGLRHALPNSFAFVLTDASAKDYNQFEVTNNLVQSTQTTVNFLTTGNCGHRNRPQFEVYNKLARSSNGQVFDMNSDDIQDVMWAIRNQMNDDFIALKSIDFVASGKSKIDFFVDNSISELTVTLTGSSPTIAIEDSQNNTVIGNQDLALKNVRIIGIKKPMTGQWSIEVSSSSAHSIRLGARSNIQFDFGFSLNNPIKISETSYQPLQGQQNILSIFTSDSSKIQSLDFINITNITMSNRLLLMKTKDNIFATEPFDIPLGSFKIELTGVDLSGNKIERLLSTSIQAVNAEVPEVTVEASNFEVQMNDSLILVCNVRSLIPIVVKWIHKGQTIKELVSNQSNALEMTIDSISKSNNGTYVCIATNDIGEVTRQVQITVLMKPLACNYTTTEFGYTCSISSIQFLNDDFINIIGVHQDEKTNDDVTGVVFLNSILTKIPVEIFETFKNVENLIVKGTKLATMNEKTFELCGKLKYLDASSNLIRDINKSSLEKCTDLETLNLHNNFITKIEPCNNFLTKLPNLKSLTLTHNMCIDQNFIHEKLNENLDKLVLKDLYRCFSKWFL